jgi:hypothetical protein
MEKDGKNRGLTYIEMMISTVVITFMIVASVNLMTRLYKYSISSQQKAFSLSLCSQRLDYLKSKGFGGLPPTPDSCIPDSNFTNLSPLETCSSGSLGYDTYYFVTTTATIYKVYSCVEWAEEDSNGNIVGKPSNELTISNPDLKQVTVVVTYFSDNMTKISRLTTLLSDKNISLSGANISGTIYKINPSGTPGPPGTSSVAAAHIVGYSAYTAYADGTTGNYTISNVAPGSYTLYADGAGLSLTYYVSNPLSVAEGTTSVAGVNFNCPQVDGGIVSGVVYVLGGSIPTPSFTNTPVIIPTFTPTPIALLLYGTGAMSGKTENWSNPGYIHANDGNFASQGSGSNKMLYTEFDNSPSPPNSCITSVKLNVYGEAGFFGSVNCNINFTDNSGVNWANLSGGWTGSTSTYFSTITLAAFTANTFTINITSLYPSWNWAEVNSLGAFFNVSPGFLQAAYIDAAWLEVDYYSCPPTFTPTNTPAYTPTYTPTPSIQYAYTANVASLDGISSIATVGVSGQYTISDINCASGQTQIISYYKNPVNGILYYASLTTTVSIGTTSYVNLTLTPTTGSTGVVTGFVRDTVGNNISGATVSINDVAGNSVSTNGGSYSIYPVVPGSNYTLSASMPGYTSASENIASVPGGAITNASVLTLSQAGSISGKITDGITSLPLGGIFVSAADSGGNHAGSDAYSDSITGYYLITGVPVGTGYTVSITIDTTSYKITYPLTSDQDWDNLVVTAGGTNTNRDFKVVPIYVNIKGQVKMDGNNIIEGLNVIAYPASDSIHAQDYHYDLSTVFQEYSGHTRMVYPSYGAIGQGDGTFSIRVPVNDAYDIYAYYSFVSYTGTPLSVTKTVVKYYKADTSVSVGTSDVTGLSITGALSAWTSY